MSPRIAFVTSRELPHPDVDEQLLLPLVPRGVLVAWEDETIDWSSYDAAILRSTWNYTDHLDEFLAWAERVNRLTRLINPLPVVRWNIDKHYLADLAAAGFATVPTVYVAAGDAIPDGALAGHIVVKPTVGAGSKGAVLIRDDADAALAHVAALHAAGKTAMIQPYLDKVDTQGETALVYVGGEFSHAARKAPILSRAVEWSTGLYADEEIVAATATADERSLADALVAALPTLVEGGGDIAYARVDLLPTASGPVVLELELTEPSLFLSVDDAAPARAAAAFVASVAGGATGR
jgi:glutathione synthase/RimK-type ligase-like ATP-grasp enzyme